MHDPQERLVAPDERLSKEKASHVPFRETTQRCSGRAWGSSVEEMGQIGNKAGRSRSKD